LVPLRGNVANKLAQAADQIGLAISLLKRTHSMNTTEVMRFVPNAVQMLESASGLLETSTATCREAAKAFDSS
jgi:hypothetical protein